LQQVEPSTWLADIKSVLKNAEKLKLKNPQRKRYDPSAKKLENRLNQLLLMNLDQVQQKETYTFQKSLVKHRHAIFTFLYYQEVPADNNSSEQAIRNAKVKMKVSGFFKSQQNTYAQIRSIIDTLIKNNKPILNTLQAVENGKNICLGL
jgi:transposase